MSTVQIRVDEELKKKCLASLRKAQSFTFRSSLPFSPLCC